MNRLTDTDNQTSDPDVFNLFNRIKVAKILHGTLSVMWHQLIGGYQYLTFSASFLAFFFHIFRVTIQLCWKYPHVFIAVKIFLFVILLLWIV